MSVGAVLSEARERAGLTLDEIAGRTCIRRTLVENIEHDDFHACGGDFYARGHVKTIAQVLHVDPAPLLAEFDREHEDPDLPTASGVLDTGIAAAAGHDADRWRFNWTAAMVVALALVLAVGGVNLVRGGSSSPSASGGAAPVAPDTSTPAPSSAPTTSAPRVGGITTSRGVTVVLSAVAGRSWVSATGKTAGLLYEKILGTGQRTTMRDDRQVKLTIGNAGAVHVLVNGRDLGPAGSKGQVVSLSFGPGDPTRGGS